MNYHYQFKQAVLKYAKKHEDMSLRAIARIFDLTPSTLIKWKTQGIESKLSTRKNNLKLDMSKLKEYVLKHSDMYQKEIAEEFNVSPSTICMALKRLGITRKKDFRNIKQDKRKIGIFQEKLNIAKALNYQILYMDESGFSYSLARLYAHSLKGERAIGYRKNHNKRKTNLIGGLLNGNLIAPFLYDFNTTSNVMLAWVNNMLLPELKQKTAIIMDNASFHKRKDIIQAIRNAGHIVIYLPPYSPELNPIEKYWAMLKSKVRKFKCSIDTLLKNRWE